MSLLFHCLNIVHCPVINGMGYSIGKNSLVLKWKCIITVTLLISGFSKWAADKHLPSNSPKNEGETGTFAEDDVEFKDVGQQN